MQSNKDKYKKDLDKLVDDGEFLNIVMQYECSGQTKEDFFGEYHEKVLGKYPSFSSGYQSWYSESKSIVKQLLPDRISDFVRYYEKPKIRKEITFENYCLEDYLQGLIVTSSNPFGDKVVKVDKTAAIPLFKQQQEILKSVKKRFESSLFDIIQLVQADLFDSELAEANELLKNGFYRGAGALAGVVIEKHLSQVMQNHCLTSRKKHLTINDYNELLKNNGVIDVPTWRQIQRIGDIRNLCDHNKDRDPTDIEVRELIDSVDKISKTLF